MSDSLMHIVKTSAQWEDRSIKYLPIPRGCLCVELTASKKTKIKIGEGDKHYSLLPYVDGECDLSQYYTKEEINNLLNNLNRMAIMSTEEYPEKEDLPLVNNKLGDVRFVKSSSPSLKLDPDIYLWNGHKWIFVGYDLVDIDLSQFIKREEFEPIVEKVNEMYPKMHTHENKDILDRVEEPYTTAEKDKLESLENYDDTEIRGLIRQATHVHPNKSILDQIEKPFKTADKEKLDSLENYDDTDLRNRVTAVESTAHTHSNKAELDSIYSGFVDEHEVLVEFKTIAENEIDSLQDDVADLKTKIHTHSNKNILDSTTAPYTREDKQTLTDLANITIFDGASATYDGFRGYVPAPRAGEQSYFLRGDGVWAKVKGGSGNKYKAGDGIFILSGDVTSDTFPFKVYSKSGHLSKYIIYGNTGGVGESMGSGVYGVNISITDDHGNTSNTSIILPEKISLGDYIDYERQVFVHMRTNMSSLVNTVDPNYRYRWAIRSNGDISPTDIGAYGSSPQVTTLVELEPGTTYELYHACTYSAFSNYMNLNVYDVDQNRTRTMNFYDSTGKVPTIIALGPNEKYIRLTWEHADWYPNTLIRVKAVETPITLPQIPLFPNSINTINVTNTIKPAEIYVEVAEPSEDDPEDPMSEYSGIIYNDGVLDITQEDPNALNELTVHFRESDKVITVPAGGSTYTAGDGINITSDVTPAIEAKLGEGLHFDTNDAIAADKYLAGQGIEIGYHEGIVVTNPEYYFDTQVTCALSGSFYREFTKTTDEPALGALINCRNSGQSDSWTGPIFVGPTASSVKCSYNTDNVVGPFTYKGRTWFSTGTNYWVDGSLTDLNHHLPRIPGQEQNVVPDDINDFTVAKMIIDAAGFVESNNQDISAKLGNGLSFDSNDAIQADQMTGADGTNAGTAGIVPAPTATDNTKFLRGDGSWAAIETSTKYTEGDAIEFGHPGMTDLGFNFDTFVSKFTQPNNGTVSVDSVNKTFTLTATGSDAYTNPWAGGDLYTIPVVGGRKYRLTWDSNAPTVGGNVYAFENGDTSHMHGVNQVNQNYLEFTADTTSNVNFRFGVSNSGDTITYSNIKFYEVDNADPDTNIINVKYSNGLSLDNNNALQVDGMVGATSQANGKSGTVPQPLIADKDKFLKGDGTWSDPPTYTLPVATTSTLGGVKVGAGLSMNANDEIGVTSPYVTSVTNQGSLAGVITVAKSDGTSSDVDVLDNMRLILNCNYDSSMTRNVLGEPVNAPVAANKTLSSIMENDLTILEV